MGMVGLCTVPLVRDKQNIIVDTGHFGNRRLLLNALKRENLSPGEIDIVVLSHMHWDHVMNVDLFPKSTFVIHAKEFKYAHAIKASDWATPPYITPILDKMKVKTISGETKLSDDVSLVETPGHTVGHISTVVKTPEGKVVIAQDALPNARSMLRQMPDLVFGNERDAKASIKKIAALGADVIYPGHDRPFRYKNGKIQYIGQSGLKVILRREVEENFSLMLATEEADKPEII